MLTVADPTTSTVAGSAKERLERFHYDYADSLDAQRYGEWPGYFVEDCRYEILSRENVDQGLPAPLMSCYSHGMVEDRVAMLVKGTLTYRHLYLKHFITNVRVIATEAGRIEASANVLVVQSTVEGVSSLYIVGAYRDIFVDDGGRLLLAERRVVVDSFGIDTMLAVPV